MYPRFAAQPGRHLMAAAGNVLERQWVVYDVGGHTSLVRTFRNPAFLFTGVAHPGDVAREMGTVLRGRQRDHLPCADLVLRPDARGGRQREPDRGQREPVEDDRVEQAPRQDQHHLVPQQVRHPGI